MMRMCYLSKWEIWALLFIINQWYFCKGYRSGTLLFFYWKLRNRSVIAIYKLILAGQGPRGIPTVSSTLAKITSSQLIIRFTACEVANTVFSYTFYLFEYAILLICVMNNIIKFYCLCSYCWTKKNKTMFVCPVQNHSGIITPDWKIKI